MLSLEHGVHLLLAVRLQAGEDLDVPPHEELSA